MIKNWTELNSENIPTPKIGIGQFVKPYKSDTNESDAELMVDHNPEIALIGSDPTIDSIRSEFYKLSDQLKGCKISDLGNLKAEMNQNPTLILQDLIKNKKLPVYISSVESSIIHHIQSVTNVQPFSTWMIAHPSLAHEVEFQTLIKKNVIEGSMKVRFIGHQAHITSSESLKSIQDLGIESMRLGHIRQNIDRIEPWCRSLDHAIFNLESLRKTDYPSKRSTNPGGFYYEEACKICQFLGASSHVQSFGIYGYDTLKDTDGTGAALIAQLIWYFIDGYIHFREDKSIHKSKLIQYVVHASHADFDINFWKSNDSGRWWMEVPGQSDHWVSCTYDDYLEASHGEFSTRLINVLNRV